MASSALATAFVNIVPGTVELERYLKGDLGKQAQAAGLTAGRSISKGLAQGLSSVGSKMSSVGQKMSLGITAPLAAIAVQSVKTAADFGVTMASMKVNSGASAAEMENLRKLAIQMGQDTVFSAGEAATAMLELSKGGMSTAAIQGGALSAAMNLAATEGISLGESAGIVVQAMNQFKIPAADAGNAVDILAAGAVASTASIGDLAAGLKYVGTTAASFKISMADTITAMAAMNNAGIDSTTAGTSLNQFMLRLIPRTEKASKTMKKLGLDFTDAKGKMLPMGKIVAQLSKRMRGLTDEQKSTALKDLFGLEGQRAALVLMQQGVKGWTDLSGAVNKQGVASELANARMSGLAGSIEVMKGSIDTAMLSIGDRLDPAVRTLTANITGLINGFASLSPATQGNIINFGLFAAAAGPALIVVGKMATGLSATITAFTAVGSTAVKAVGGIANFATGLTNAAAGSSAFATPMMKLGGAIRSGSAAMVTMVADMGRYIAASAVSLASTAKDLAIRAAHATATLAMNVASKAAAAGQWLLNAAMSANPIALVVIAVAALVAGLVWFFTQTKIGQKIWAGFVGFMSDSAKNVVAAWNATIAWFGNLPSAIGGFFSSAGSWLVGAGKNIIQGLLNGAGSLLKGIGNFFLNMLPGWIVAPFKAALGIHSPSKVFASFGKNIIQGLHGGLMSEKTTVTDAMKKVSDWITNAFNDKKISAKQKKAATALIGAYSAQLSKLEVQHTALMERLDDAQKALADKIQERADYIKGLAAQFGSTLTIDTTVADQADIAAAKNDVAKAQEKYNELLKDTEAKLTDIEDARLALADAEKKYQESQNTGTSAAKAIAELKAKVAKTQELQKVTDQLMTMGLDKTLYKQIVEAGAVDFAKSIIEGGATAVNELNVLSKQADAAALDLASKVGDTLYSQGIQFAQSVVDGLKSQEAALTAIMDAVASAFERQISLVVQNNLKAINAAVASAAAQAKAAVATATKAVAAKTPATPAKTPTAVAKVAGSTKMIAMAAGGFVNGPTPALIGEAGPEVVTPLKDFERMMGVGSQAAAPSITYIAAPNQSLDAEQALFQAIKRAKVVGAW